MRKSLHNGLFYTLSVFLIAGISSMGCGDDDASCDSVANPCTVADATQCSGDIIQACNEDADGCLIWETDTNCGDTSQVCDDSAEPATCEDVACTDDCTTVDDTQCTGTVIETCTVGTDGCNDWVAGTDCNDTAEVCNDSAEPAVCAACNDDCATVDETQCNGTVIETCTVGLDSCNDWVAGTDCTDTGEACNDTAEPAVCVAFSCAEALLDGGFEVGTPSTDWTEASTAFGTPLCDAASCGLGGGTGPNAGAWWAWFGGVNAAVEVGTVSQSVTLAAGETTTLFFFLEIPVSTGEATDTLVVSVDGNAVFTATGADAASYPVYTLVTVDLSAYADGNAHTLLFTGTTQGTTGVTNMFVDDVSVGSGDGCCIDLCDPVNSSFCDGSIPTYCEVGASSCNEWVASPDCATSNEVCEIDVNDDAVCLACTDECPTVDEIQCTGDVIETCTVGADTCNDWVAGLDCGATGQYCDGTAVCADFTAVTPGNDCTDVNMVPINVPADLPAQDTAQTTCGAGDDYSATCLGVYDGGEDLIYELNVTATTIVGFGVDPNASDYTGISLDDTCPAGAADCIFAGGNSSATPYTPGCYALDPGSYYLMVDTWPDPMCILDFDLTLYECACATGDTFCVDANTVSTCDAFGENVETTCANGCGEFPQGSGVNDCVPTLTEVTVDGGWVAGELVTGDTEQLFYFTGTEATTYYVWWDDSFDGSATYTLDLEVSGYEEDLATPYFSFVDSGYTTSEAVTIAAGETTVYVVATPYTTGSLGTFAVAVSSTDVQP